MIINPSNQNIRFSQYANPMKSSPQGSQKILPQPQGVFRNSMQLGSPKQLLPQENLSKQSIHQNPITQSLQQQKFYGGPQILPVNTNSFSDRPIYEQELNRGRLHIAELEKQIILIRPELDLWRNKYQQKEQEIQQLKQQQMNNPPIKQKEVDHKLESDYIIIKSILEERDEELNELIKINYELQQKLQEQNQKTSTDEYVILLEQKDRENDSLRLDKLRQEKEITALLAENRSLYLQQSQQKKRQQQQQEGCL